VTRERIRQDERLDAEGCVDVALGECLRDRRGHAELVKRAF
jgi:hypothetical protein